MDFKSLMAAQIAKSKPSTPSTTTTTTIASAGKYQRRSDLEAQRQAEYAAEQAKLEREREERAAKKRKFEEEEAEKNSIREAKLRKLADESRIRREEEQKEEERRRRKRLGLPEVIDESEAKRVDDEDEGGDTATMVDQPDIPDDELQAKLRQLNEPTKLFDKDHTSRLKRYYNLTSSSSSSSNNTSLTTTTTKPSKSTGPIPTTLLPVPEKDMLIPLNPPSSSSTSTSNPQAYTFLHRQLASYFTLLLTEWHTSLLSRSPAVQSSQPGQAAYNIYLSVIRDLTPLYRKLESQSLTPDLLSPLCEITRNIQLRKYVDANDGYLRLSIGKAAWPIGVTMVGIHERSARERIHDGAHGGGGERKAHILSDEVTRKMLQSVKRCVSFAQTRWPPDDVGQLMG